MKMKLVASTLVTLGLSFNVYAQKGSGTQSSAPLPSNAQSGDSILATPTMLHAPQVGMEIDLGYHLSQYNLKQAQHVGDSQHYYDYDTKGESQQLSVNAAIAINKNIFISAEIGNAKSKSSSEYGLRGVGEPQKSERDDSGYSDPTFAVGGRWNTDVGISLIGSLRHQMKSGDSESQTISESKSEGNQKSGGSETTPSVTVFTNSKSKIMFGGTMGYTIRSDRKRDQVNRVTGTAVKSSSVQKGGNSLSTVLFIESPETKLQFGGALSYDRSEKGEVESENSMSSFDVDPSSVILAMAYMRLNLTKEISLIPSLAYGQFGEGYSGYSQKDFSDFGLSGRVSF